MNYQFSRIIMIILMIRIFLEKIKQTFITLMNLLSYKNILYIFILEYLY